MILGDNPSTSDGVVEPLLVLSHFVELSLSVTKPSLVNGVIHQAHRSQPINEEKQIFGDQRQLACLRFNKLVEVRGRE